MANTPIQIQPIHTQKGQPQKGACRLGSINRWISTSWSCLDPYLLWFRLSCPNKSSRDVKDLKWRPHYGFHTDGCPRRRVWEVFGMEIRFKGL